VRVWALGAISGASLNPARSFGPALVFSTTPLSWYGLYVTGPILGGLVAAVLFKAIFRGEK